MNTFNKICYFIFFTILALVFIKLLLVLLLILLLLCWFQTWHMRQGASGRIFLSGRVPGPKPDGFYQGTIGFKTPWVGKKFSAENSTGINVFENDKGIKTEKYPFATSVGTGLFDEKLFVLKIDYNIKGNPFWVRWILDEIVETTPGQYLGKMNLRIIPGFPFSLIYFQLKK